MDSPVVSEDTGGPSVTESPNVWQCNKRLGPCFGELFQRELWSDLTLLCQQPDSEDTTSMKVHKLVLATRSPVFEAMVFGPCAETGNEIKVEIENMEIFTVFMKYLYTDRVVLTEDVAKDLIKVAHRYQVDRLVSDCANFMHTCVTTQNACELLQMALLYDQQKMKDAVCRHIDEHAEAVLKTEGFMICSQECLTYILKGNTLNVSEVKIFEQSMEWGRRRCEDNNQDGEGGNVKAALGDAFFYLRIPTMSLKDFMACTKGQGYLSIEEYEGVIEQMIDPSKSTLACPIARSSVEENVKLDRTGSGKTKYKKTLRVALNVNASVDVALTCLYLSQIHIAILLKNKLYKQGEDLFDYDIEKGKIPFDELLAFAHILEGYTPDYYEAIFVKYICHPDIDCNILPTLRGTVTCNDTSVSIFPVHNTSNGDLLCKLHDPLYLKARAKYELIIHFRLPYDERLIFAVNLATRRGTAVSNSGTIEVSTNAEEPNVISQLVFSRPSGRTDISK